jgi:hypothetical protein
MKEPPPSPRVNFLAASRRGPIVLAVRRLAVLVNPRAQRVSPRVIAALREHVPAEAMWVTTSAAEAQAAAAAIVRGDYQAVAVGGGDGTFVQLVTDLDRLLGAAAPLPLVVPLGLGTGNAIADVCGVPSRRGGRLGRRGDPADLAETLARARSDEATRPLRLLEVAGRLVPFAGVGLDADYAADYRRLVKENLAQGPARALVRGAPGLVLTACALTVPRLLVRPRRAMRLIAQGGPTVALAPDGRPTGARLAPGDTIFAGAVTIAAAATIWSYSHGMRFFPFADAVADAVPGAFHLRVATLGGLGVLAALPRGAFDGTYRHPRRLFDFACGGFTIELEVPAPFHGGGDVEPAARSIAFASAARTVPILVGDGRGGR